MKVLVTGATGLVGSRLLEQFAARGHVVLGVSRHPPLEAPPRAALETLDLTDRARVFEFFGRFRPEVVVHAAALTDVDACERAPELAFSANVDATANVTRAARLHGAHLVHLSTDYVFDGNAGPYREEDVPNPRGVYALTKRAAEETVLALMPRAAIARTAVVFGYPPSAARTNFGTWMVENLRAGRPVRLFSDQFISPTLAENAAEMIGELAERKLEGVWHTAGGTVLDRVSFGRALCAEFGLDPGLLVVSTISEAAPGTPRPARCGLITQKVREQLSARPLPVDEALRRFRLFFEAIRG